MTIENEYENNILMSLWVDCSFGAASLKSFHLFEMYGSAFGIYEAAQNGMITDVQFSKSLDRPKKIFKFAKDNNITLLARDNEDYPELLKNIQDPPILLFVRGDLNRLKGHLKIGCVGTRRDVTPYARSVVKKICPELAGRGVVIVSGMAKGIDTMCHDAAVQNSGITVAVLGCGIDVIYPFENKMLMEDIVRCGAVVSEFLPGEQPIPFHFPVRNRIIAGLSHGVFVVQAAHRSGALSTARNALDQGKEIFTVQGSIVDDRFEGNRALLRDGAILIDSADDIVSEYSGMTLDLMQEVVSDITTDDIEESTQSFKEKFVADLISKGYSETEAEGISILCDDDYSIDQICTITNISPNVIIKVVTKLELSDIIIRLNNNKFGLKNISR